MNEPPRPCSLPASAPAHGSVAQPWHQVTDHGALTHDPSDDYPAPCIAAAEATVADPGSLGIVLGGSGNGKQMAANLAPGAPAALVWNLSTATLARSHNNANVIALGACQHTTDAALALVDAFVAEPLSGEARHQRRIDQMARYKDRAPAGTG
ncbi:RpiB/LacA/LacB family sugar-phosphate isomerase [Streptomyces sp. NBC_00006]|uniref:RpiB/LacA/LacB family sugar-phosphate isomerase n=1 Tax=unclassified Streptomyces TaxID=2593676 RepID=UPI00224D4A92|nr:MULTISPECIES: RpiB/LacA/LacB family sugar-phosphate isomerase [unclassified Streptomyces]MCX5535866.1 RpiB/LacA/LacB family sugar-phosphate isomerase [Streptomyces sp. NBC_00006]